MGSGSGKSRRARSVTPAEASETEYVWCEIGDVDQPEMSDEEFDRYMHRLTPVLRGLLEDNPDLRELAGQITWGICTEEDEEGFGACSRDEDTGEAILLVHTRAVDSLSDEELRFVIAHELAHIELGHTGAVLPEQDGFQIVGRMMKLATEPLVNDRVASRGVVVPRDLSAPTPTGEDAFGFSLSGLSRREVWNMLDGRVSRAELQALAQTRRGEIAPDEDWNDEVLSPSEEAKEFWTKHMSYWQPAWAEDHDELVAKRRSQ